MNNLCFFIEMFVTIVIWLQSMANAFESMDGLNIFISIGLGLIAIVYKIAIFEINCDIASSH